MKVEECAIELYTYTVRIQLAGLDSTYIIRLVNAYTHVVHVMWKRKLVVAQTASISLHVCECTCTCYVGKDYHSLQTYQCCIILIFMCH